MLRRAQQAVAGTGPQLSFRGARALELVPPEGSVPMWPESPGVESDTNWRGAPGGSKLEAKQASLRSPHQTVANECSWSYWRTARTPGRHRLFRRSWPDESPEECRFLLNTQLTFLKKEKRPRLRSSSTTTRKIASRVTSKTLTLRKFGPSDGRVLTETRLTATSGTQ